MVGPRERRLEIDVLRGAALFGVLLVNTVTAFRVSIFDASRSGSPVLRAMAFGVESKAFMLFAFLFGVGLAMQRASGAPVARRLAGLLVIGLAHFFLVWSGDILVLYAVTGALAAPLLKRPLPVLLLLAAASFAIHLAPIPWPPAFESREALAAHVAEASRAYGHGSFADAMAFRFAEARPMACLDLWAAPRTLSLLFLGAAAWKSRLLDRPRPWLALGLVLSGGAALWFGPAGASASIASLVLALGYGAAILAVASHVSFLAPIGRLALTGYLASSVLLSFVFYGWGLGLFGALGPGEATLVACSIYAAEVLASALWVRRFRHGPVEWLWRRATYGRSR